MKEQLFCIVCGNELTGNQKKFCSNNCKQKDCYDNNKVLNSNTLFKQNAKGIIRKLQLIDSKGGKCEICGYDKNISALDFHHSDPNLKEFSLDKRTLGNSSIEKITTEADKCILLCANCHREVHNPDTTLENMIQFKIDNIDDFKKSNFDVNFVAPKNYCECGKEISYGAKQCVKCHSISMRTVERPTKEELLELIKTTPFLTIGKMFGVADNTIRKWCKAYDLPSKYKDIKLLK